VVQKGFADWNDLGQFRSVVVGVVDRWIDYFPAR
jgi:hypothetical protein